MASAEGMAMSEGRNPGYREQQDGRFKHFKWLKHFQVLLKNWFNLPGLQRKSKDPFHSCLQINMKLEWTDLTQHF